MLLRLKIKNFLSFYEETVFDMFPNPKRISFPNHIYSDMKVPLLKQAAIFGPNGSGKSNFIKAISFLKSLITNEIFLKNIDLDDYYFQLVSNNQLKISFEIEFYNKERYFIYNIDIDKKSINESLHLSGLGKTSNKLLFKRSGNEIISDSLQNKDSASQLLKLNPFSSILPLNQKYPVLQNPEINKAFDWFQNKVDIVPIYGTLPMLIDLMAKKPDLLKFTNEVFDNIGAGINSIKVADTPLDVWMSDNKNSTGIQQILNNESLKPNMGFTRIENNRNIFSVSMKKGIKTVQEILFDQAGISNYHKDMKISAQSDGTVRLLILIPAFFNAVKNQKVVFIDEIDNSIHPNLMFSLLQYFANSNSKGQLIFTTHTTKLINQQELLRPDEIWLTEMENGSSKMYSINDFKIHNTINLENGYLDGRFGAIPEIGDFNVS